MVVYLDVLIATNMVLDYLILNITSLLVRRSYSLKRIVIASLLGGFSSVYIFLKSFWLVDILFNVAVALIMISIVTGFKNLKSILNAFAIFMLISCSLSGFVELLGRSYSEVFFNENLVNYINISPLLLIVATSVMYIVIMLVRKFIDKKSFPKTVKLEIKIGEHSECFLGLVDTGHSVTDPFGSAQVFIIDSNKFSVFKEKIGRQECNKRKRLIPVKTIGGSVILDAFRCDKAKVSQNNEIYYFENSIIAASNENIGNGYSAIVSAVCLERAPDRK